MILGIDEVGRGPWAGPLVVGAVVLNGARVEGLADSKALSKRRREALYTAIKDSDAVVGLGWVHADELDELGLSLSLVEATKRALVHIHVPYHEIIIDGTVNFLKGTTREPYVTTMKKADALVPTVSAAAIVAKVARDEYMTEQAAAYPQYGFDSHVGYGTAAHRKAIDKHGLTPLHRRSFASLGTVHKRALARSSPSATDIGNLGEDSASLYLQSNGFEIIERNWKTRLCEIDIVAKKDEVLFFVEVKQRKNDAQGGGLYAITPKKLRQMRFAADMYVHFHRTKGDVRMAVIVTAGPESKFVSMTDMINE